MITGGIDVGAKTVKVVILKDGEIAGKAMVMKGFDAQEAIKKACDGAFKEAAISRGDVENIIATGKGAEEAKFLTDNLTAEVTADARGIFKLFPDVRTLIDVGAEEGCAVKVDNEGKVVDFAVNERCAAGSGTFVESMSRVLEMSLEEFGRASLDSDKTIAINAHCAVFAESEVVSLVHAKHQKTDISRAVHDAMAEHVVSMVRRIGLEKPIAMVGGLSRNVGFTEALNRVLEAEIRIPAEPEFVGALGAALLAAE